MLESALEVLGQSNVFVNKVLKQLNCAIGTKLSSLDSNLLKKQLPEKENILYNYTYKYNFKLENDLGIKNIFIAVNENQEIITVYLDVSSDLTSVKALLGAHSLTMTSGNFNSSVINEMLFWDYKDYNLIFIPRVGRNQLIIKDPKLKSILTIDIDTN